MSVVGLQRSGLKKPKYDFILFHTELLRIGLDSKIAEQESLWDSIESEMMHLNEVTIELKALNLAAAEM